MIPATWMGMLALVLIGVCFGVLIGHFIGAAEERERWNNVGKMQPEKRPTNISNPYAGLTRPHWNQPCPATITGQHEWIEVSSLPDDPPGYYRKFCVACSSNKIGPTDASPKALGGKA